MRLNIKSDAGQRQLSVATFAEASKAVRDYIAENDLGAGCSPFHPAFRSAVVYGREPTRLATVSYNGRVWDPEEKEIKTCPA